MAAAMAINMLFRVSPEVCAMVGTAARAAKQSARTSSVMLMIAPFLGEIFGFPLTKFKK
jgi:hypothetical protein